MGKMWQALDEKAKGPYEKKAEAAKKKYAEEMAAYEAWALDILCSFSGKLCIAFQQFYIWQKIIIHEILTLSVTLG